MGLFVLISGTHRILAVRTLAGPLVDILRTSSLVDNVDSRRGFLTAEAVGNVCTATYGWWQLVCSFTFFVSTCLPKCWEGIIMGRFG